MIEDGNNTTADGNQLRSLVTTVGWVIALTEFTGWDYLSVAAPILGATVVWMVYNALGDVDGPRDYRKG